MMMAILLVFLALPVLYCLGTFAFAGLLGSGGRRFLNLAGVRAVVREVWFQYQVWAMLPVDLCRSRWSEEPEAPGPIVILIPGFTDTDFIFSRLRRALSRAGCGYITYRYNTFRYDPDHEAPRLGRLIEDVLASYPGRRVVLAGHSLGGLLARHCLGLDPRYRRLPLVAMAVPHTGTKMARLAFVGGVRQAGPGSPWLKSLTGEAPPLLLNIRTEHDNLVVPPVGMGLPVIRDVVIASGWGHNSLMWCAEAIDAAVDWILEGEDDQGYAPQV